MLADSGLLNDIQRFAFSTTGQPMCLYGDPAYPLSIHLQALFRNEVLTQDFNSFMSAECESVEWLFGDIVEYFKCMDFYKNLKIGVSFVGEMYIASALLCNAHTCMEINAHTCNGNQTSEYFNLKPPTLEEELI